VTINRPNDALVFRRVARQGCGGGVIAKSGEGQPMHKVDA
jgi:hypothetical protein